MQNSATKKTVLITGASSGIGLATAKHFAVRGWNVVATMRRPQAAPEELHSDKFFLQPLDVLDDNSIKNAIQNAIEKFGGIDAVVNNAGFGVMGVFEPTPAASIKRQFDTNVFGLMSVVREVLPHFREKKNGVFINISSVGGRTTFPLFSLYHATKFAIEGFTESLRYELEGLGIRVKLVEPGGVLTDFGGRSLDRVTIDPSSEYANYSQTLTAKIEKAAKQGQTPEEVATVIFRAACDPSSRLRYVSGGQAKFLLAVRKLFPESLFHRFMRFSLNAI